MLEFRVPEYDKAKRGRLLVDLEWCFDGPNATFGYIQVTPMTNGDLPLAHQIASLPGLKIKLERLLVGLVKIEERWRDASQDKCFRQHYRETMRECAEELRHLLNSIDDNELAELEKVFEAGEL